MSRRAPFPDGRADNMAGKSVIITGANCGLGFESARVLARSGARITLACRSREAGEQAATRIRQEVPSAALDVMALDLASLASIRAFVTGWRERHERLDILMNNAGVMTTPLFRTADGFEGQIGINHFGHFALTGLLWPLLSTTQHSRVVTVSSVAHKGVRLHFDNLNFENETAYTPMRAYQASKLANLLFMYELARRIKKAGSEVISCAAHPGASLTNLGRHLDGKWFYELGKPVAGLILPSPAKAARSQVRAAMDPDVVSGDYFGPSGPGEWMGVPTRVRSTRQARDEQAAAQLWATSEALTGVVFP